MAPAGYRLGVENYLGHAQTDFKLSEKHLRPFYPGETEYAETNTIEKK